MKYINIYLYQYILHLLFRYVVMFEVATSCSLISG